MCWTAPSTNGPVEAKLRSYPPLLKLVSGPNVEFSWDTHKLLQVMADCNAQYQCQSKGLAQQERGWKERTAHDCMLHTRGHRVLQRGQIMESQNSVVNMYII